MDDDLDRFRRQFEEDRSAAEEARARRIAERQREKDCEAAWDTVFLELRRWEAGSESPVNLDPLERLVDSLKDLDQVKWLVEIRNYLREDLGRGWDTHDGSGRAELWFANVLLCLSQSPPDREQATHLLTEMRQRGFSPFGIASIAGEASKEMSNERIWRRSLRASREKTLLPVFTPKHVHVLHRRSSLFRSKSTIDGNERQNLPQYRLSARHSREPKHGGLDDDRTWLSAPLPAIA